MADFVKIEKRLGPEGRIAVVRFDRGDGINAMSPEALRQLTDAARSFEDDGATSVVVLTGGAKSFSAGFDLKDPEGRSRKSMDLGALRRHLKLGPRLTRAWQDMEQITIGAIEGFCVGGGVALSVALDFRVMARDAHMRVPEIGLGMNMSWQSVPRMLHLMGPARTKQALILADQRIAAAEAYEWGLVEEVADPGKAFDAAMTLAAKIAAQPPLSVAMTKLTVNRLAHEQMQIVLGAGHGDIQQPAFFLDLRGRSGAEIGGHAAIDHVKQEHRFPFLAFGGVDRRQDQVVLIQQGHASLVAGGIGRIER